MNIEARVRRAEAELPAPPEERTGDERRWIEAFYEAADLVLATMPQGRARAVIAELPRDVPRSAITARVLALARSAVPANDSLWECPNGEGCVCGHHYGRNRPLALPETVCRLLERERRMVFSLFDCARCGYQSGERPQDGTRSDAELGHFRECPLCGGPVGPYAFGDGRVSGPPAAERRRKWAGFGKAWCRRYGVRAEAIESQAGADGAEGKEIKHERANGVHPDD